MSSSSGGHGHLGVVIGLALTGFAFVIAGRRTTRRHVAAAPAWVRPPRQLYRLEPVTPPRTEPATNAAARAPTSEPATDGFVPTTAAASAPAVVPAPSQPGAVASLPFAAVPTRTESLVPVVVSPSSDAVMSPVALALTHTFGLVPASRFDPPPAGDGTLAGIASKAALFLAETGAGGNGHSPGPHDAVAEALRRTGLDETVVAPVAAGLRHGMGLEALLLEAFGLLPPAPPVPRRTGSLLVVVGAGPAARRLAAALATEIGIDAAEVPFASRHDGAHAVVTGKLLVRSAEDAAELAPGWRRAQAAVVVVDAAVTGSARSWATHLIAALRPTAVWGVVDSTAKTEDIAAWAEALGGVDALALENLEATVSPASCLGAGIPVARIDGQPATATRWAAAIVDRMAPCT